ncbi:MAG: hypothetical protein IPO54_07710 [Micavibrio sp.]|nr:hypothetical protein [Micavibrio sp.]
MIGGGQIYKETCRSLSASTSPSSTVKYEGDTYFPDFDLE